MRPSVSVRLFAQGEGFDGVRAVTEHTHAQNPAPTQVDSEIAALIDACVALEADSPLVDRRERLLLPRVAYFFDIKMPVPPGARPLLKELQNFTPSIHPFLCPSRHAGHVPLDRRIERRRSSRRITAARG